MDQTPLWLSMHPTTTLNLCGQSTVNGRRTTDLGSCFTVSLGISANGDKLKPMCIFKGAPNGRIVTREFAENPHCDDVVLACQKTAWQDEQNMLQWIDKVLVPYLQEKAAGAPACILLDRFPAHWTNGIKTKIESLDLTPYKIPAGCTGLTQPIDVGVGKPFKDHVRQKWWEWLLM